MEGKSRGFGTRIGYIMTLAGFCIGISNMWKFPYMVGANGGGTFLLIYVICAIVIGFPLFILEQQLGRTSGLGGMMGMKKLTEGKKGAKGWSFFGGTLGVITIIIIAFYFWTILGWVLGYLWKCINGSLMGMTGDQIGEEFTNFSGSPGCLLASAICAVFMWLMLNTDFKKGVEKLCTYALPTLIILLIGLAIYSCTLPGAGEGVKWYLSFNTDVDIFACIQAAVVQVFFSVGIGMSCAFVYGSYLKKDANLTQDATIAIGMDTLVAFLSGMVCTPALFAFGIEPTAGPGLIFVSLPQLFNAMGPVAGRAFGIIFMFAVFLACITSMAAIQESVVANFGDKYGWARKKANTFAVLLTFGGSILVTLNFGNGPLSGVIPKLLNMELFSFLDMLGSAFGLTIGAIAMVLFVGYVYGFETFQEEANMGSTKIRIAGWMKYHYKIILPIILFFAFYCIVRSYFG